MTAFTGQIIDNKFELLEPLGTGGFASVYRARQLVLDRMVAIKMLDASPDEEALVKRFEREAKILMDFQSKFIPTIYGYGVWQGRPYIAMEIVEGVNFNELLRREHVMSFDQLKPIIAAVAAGLEHAHSHGVVHRDLTPANILVVNQQSMPAARIIDFGLAGFAQPNLRDRQHLTEAGYALGTVRYMSPEQCKTEEVDGRSDIYALGCIIYRALVGSVPFDSDNPIFVMQKQVSEPLPALPQDLPAGVQKVVAKATEKEPGKRFQTAADFLAEWDAIEPSVRNAPPRFTPNLSLLALAMIVIVAVMSLSMFFRTWQEEPGRQNLSAMFTDAARQFKTVSDQKEHTSDRITKAHEEELITSYEKILQLDNKRHGLSPMQRETALEHLAHLYMSTGRSQHEAVQLDREALISQVKRNVLWLDTYYYQNMLSAPATDKTDRDGGIEDYQKLLQHQPAYPRKIRMDIQLNMVNLYILNKQFDKARASMPKYEECEPDNVRTWVHLSHLLEM